MPETDAFQEHQRLRAQAAAQAKSSESGHGKPSSVSSTFLRQGKVALRRHWVLLGYMVLLMAGFNFMSHGSQDLYPTMLESQYGFDADMVTVTQVVANLGAMTGGTIVGYCSQIVGRRISIIACCILGGALLYPYTFVDNPRIMAAAFFTQFAVQGAWGVIPIHLMELSPGAFRTFVVGTAYQLGNLASSASSTIESRLGERFPLPPSEKGAKRYEYGKVMCIFMGCVFAYVIVLTFLGPEYLRRSFAIENDADAIEVAGRDTVDRVERHTHHENTTGDEESGQHEKTAARD
jgi:SHS family lactate transporter-like MFS transporter